MSLKGEMTFEAAGRSWTAAFTTNAIVRAEERLGLGFGAIAAQVLGAGRIGFIRGVLWAGLVDANPKLTEDQVGGLIDEIGLKRAGELLGEAFRSAYPDVYATADGEGDAASPQAPAGETAGTGPSSSGNGAA